MIGADLLAEEGEDGLHAAFFAAIPASLWKTAVAMFWNADVALLPVTPEAPDGPPGAEGS